MPVRGESAAEETRVLFPDRGDGEGLRNLPALEGRAHDHRQVPSESNFTKYKKSGATPAVNCRDYIRLVELP